MITKTTFMNAQNFLNKRRYKNAMKSIHKEVEGQLRRLLKRVKSGSLDCSKVCVIVNVSGQYFPSAYEKKLKKRGFAVLQYGDYDIQSNTQRFRIVLEGCKHYYLINEVE